MPRQETEYSKIFVDCAIKQGGHAFKIAMSTVSGLPDLYCAMPGYVPVLLEAKLIKDVGGTFKRKINYSKLQHNLLKDCNRVYNNIKVAYGLVFVKDYMGEDYCCLMDPDLPQLTNLDITSPSVRGVMPVYKGMIDVVGLFTGVVAPTGIRVAYITKT